MKKTLLVLFTFLFVTNLSFASLYRHTDNPDLTLNNHGVECQCKTTTANYPYPFEFDLPEDKVYVSPDQVIVSEEGLFIVVDSVCIKVREIQCDDEGPYVNAAIFEKRCWNGHPVLCDTCTGCSRLLCQFRCKCWAS